MRIASVTLPASLAFGLFASICGAQSDIPAIKPDAASAVITADQNDSHEDQATTRSVSQIRIVRLSQVRGQVQLDRKTDQKFEPAFANLPIIAGEQLRTQQGVAEVEFEDNSSVRLVTDSLADFPKLGRSDSGATLTAVRLLRGSMYVSLASGKVPRDFTVQVGRQALTLAPASHIRVDITDGTAKLTVFQGTVTAASGSGSVVVGKRKAITFDLNAEDAPVFAKLDDPGPFDQWDKNAVDYHKYRAVAATYASSPYSYGVNDLAYYGSFSNVAGCGTIWRPYLATAAFDPYASGVWTWYPSVGYSWVSVYPWGWLPYHSGNWAFCGEGVGWGWQPQGNWNGLQNVPSSATKFKLAGHPIRPKPPLPPVKGQATIVTVNLAKLQVSKPGVDGAFVFHGESAGLGVPRGVFNNLNKISQNAVEHGTVIRSLSETQAARTNIVAASAPTVSGSMVGGRQNSSTVEGRNSFAGNAGTHASVGSASVGAAHSASSFPSAPSSAPSMSSSMASSSAASSGGGKGPH